MPKDNRFVALLGVHIPFASDDAAAFLGNTRTQLFGSDHVEGAEEALFAWPGTADVGAHETLKNFRAADAGAGTSAPAQDAAQSSSGSGKPFYDCKTGKCSDGSDPRTSSYMGWFDRWTACALGNRRVLEALCEGSGGGVLDDPYSKAAGGATQEYADDLRERYLKRITFILLAIILIYAGVRAYGS